MSDEPTSAYWFAEAGIRELLEAVRRFRRADQQMRRRASAAMGMNVTDMQALQEVISAERRGVLVTANLLATNLGISTASTTKLLDRLTASGHLERRPHPHDRRAVVVVATELVLRRAEAGGTPPPGPADPLHALRTWNLDPDAGVPASAGAAAKPGPGRPG